MHSTVPHGIYLDNSPGRVLVFSMKRDPFPELVARLQKASLEIEFAHSCDDLARIWATSSFDACLFHDCDEGRMFETMTEQLAEKTGVTQCVLLMEPSGDATSVLALVENASVTERCVFAELAATDDVELISTHLLRAVQHGRALQENRRLKRQLASRILQTALGESPAIRYLKERTVEAAQSEMPVLIRGDRGTGTNLVAQAIHEGSRRSHRPFVKLSCRLLTSEGLERELFGEQSAGGHGTNEVAHCGRLELAAGGTLLLDDVESIALPVQARLSRILQRKSFSIHGRQDARRLDVRFLAASHADLRELVARGAFLEEFYNRLSEITITTPALRERREDIGQLTEHFLLRLAVKEGRPVKRLSVEALELLQKYDWPGHVRELQNVIERACVLNSGSRLTADMVRPWLSTDHTRADQNVGDEGLTLKDMERKLIETTFARCAGNRERTAQILQIGLRTLSGKLREYGYPPRGGPGSNLKSRPAKAA